MTGAAAVLDELRGRRARVYLFNGRVRIEATSGLLLGPLLALARGHRDEIAAALYREACSDLAVAGDLVLDRAASTAADWRGHYEERAAVLEYEGAMGRASAESRAFVELAVEWTLAHPEVDALPSCQAEPIARGALAELSIFDPRRRT